MNRIIRNDKVIKILAPQVSELDVLISYRSVDSILEVYIKETAFLDEFNEEIELELFENESLYVELEDGVLTIMVEAKD